MNKILNRSRRGLGLLLAAVVVWSFGHCPSADALPPAPYHVIYGLVRDQYGTPLSSATSSVVLQTQAGGQLTGQIIPGLAAGVNYQIKVPMDAGETAQLYRPDALVVNTVFTMLVDVGSVTNLPIEMQGNPQVLGIPGGSTQINLTLGVDSNGDGIPDAFENAYMAALGVNVPLSTLNAHSILGRNGLTMLQAYLLGLPVFDPNTPFEVTMVGFAGTSPVIEFPGMTGRSYTVLGSPDLNTWTPLTINLPTDAPSTPAQSFFYSSSIQTIQVQVNLPAPGPAAMYLKVQLQ